MRAVVLALLSAALLTGRVAAQAPAHSLYHPEAAASGEKAGAGDANAAFELGMAYLEGRTSDSRDRSGFEWIRAAAEKGHVRAQYVLGTLYRDARGVFRDEQQAAQWFLKAAQQQHVQAMSAVAFCYVSGQGLAENYEQAVFWYKQAADRGDPEAQINMAIATASGYGGLKKDRKAARQWLLKAARQGDERAAAMLAELDGP